MTKDDTEYEESEGHPDLRNADEPRTTKAHEAIGKKRKSRLQRELGTSSNAIPIDDGLACGTQNECKAKESRARKRQRLSSYEVSGIVVEKNIKDRTELMALANIQKREGKTDLAQFVFNRGTMMVNEVISNA